MLGIIISGYGKPTRWIAPIKSYQDTEDGRAYTEEQDGTWHFNELQDIVQFDPEDNTGIIGGNFRIPHDKIRYIGV